MAETDFRDLQYAFARHIRDPERFPAPDGSEDRRMAIYRDLFFNNLRNLLGQTFPVLCKLHSAAEWQRLVRAFMAQHESATPYFLEIPREFVEFLQSEYQPADDDYPFLAELAHYEWIELALSVSDDVNDDLRFDADGDLLAGIPVLSRLARALTYRFPVHRISTEYTPREAPEGPTFLVVCRLANDDMEFTELNPVTARLLEMIAANDDRCGRELLEQLADDIAYPDAAAFVEHGHAILREMRDKQILLGVK